MSDTATKETKEQIRKRNEKKILECAEMVFAENGYRGASISMIADRAGVPKSNVIYYFPSKDHLYQSVLSHICRLWLEAGDEIHVDNEPAPALRSYIFHKMDLARERPHGSKVWANEVIGGCQFIEEFLNTYVKEWTDTRCAVVEHWMEKGLLKQMDPRPMFYMIWSTTQHYADFNIQIAHLNGGEPLTDAQWQEAKETVAEIIIGGLRPSG